MLKQTLEAIKKYFIKPKTKVYYLPYVNEIITVTEHKTVEVVQGFSGLRLEQKSKEVSTYRQLSSENPNEVVLLGDL